MDYEWGLEQLSQLAQNTEWFEEYLTYEARLRPVIKDEELYGTTPQTQADIAKIVGQLNRLTLSRTAEISFNSLCIRKNSEKSKLHAIMAKQNQTSAQAVPASLSLAENTRFSSPNKVFISYSHEDSRYLEELRTHLNPYIQGGGVTYWDDRKVYPDAIWQKEIENALNTATAALLLISRDFLASEVLTKYELPFLLNAAKSGNMTILSIIVRTCVFADTNLAQFQPVNPPTKPLDAMRPGERDEIWVQVAQLIKGHIMASPSGIIKN